MVVEQEHLGAIDRMAAGIAHDLNNSLAPVVGFSELLLIDAANADDGEGGGGGGGLSTRQREWLELIRSIRPRRSSRRETVMLLCQVVGLRGELWCTGGGCGGEPADVPLSPDAANEVPLERPSALTRGTPLVSPPLEVGAGGRIAARLDDRDLVHEAVQTAVAVPVEAVADAPGAGRLQWRNTGHRSQLRVPEARSWRPHLGDEPRRDDRPHADDLGQWGEPRPHGTVEVRAQLALLARQERELRRELPDGLLPRTGKRPRSRRDVALAGADTRR